MMVVTAGVVAWLVSSPPVAGSCTTTTVLNSATIDDVKSFTQPQIFGDHRYAQTFVAGASCQTLNKITFSICKSGAPADLVVEILGTDGTGRPLPVGTTPVSDSVTNLASAVTGACAISSATYTDLEVTFGSPPDLAGGTKYALVVRQAGGGGDGANYYQWGIADGNTYTDGRFWKAPPSTWNSPNGNGLLLDVAHLSICTSACTGGTPPPTCVNTPGVVCCGFTQGAYGAVGSVATALGNQSCSTPVGMGIIPQGACNGNNIFASDPNATTVGIHGTRAVTIGPGAGGTFDGTFTPSGTNSFPTDLNTLAAYLPTGGTPGSFSSGLYPGADRHFTAPSDIAPSDSTSGGTASKGSGSGTLAGQDMTSRISGYLSSAGELVSGFLGFGLPASGGRLCTRRAGEDKVLNNGDDICEAFLYPSCVFGATVADVISQANTRLSGTSTVCSPSQLVQALANINREFDNCGLVIACNVCSTTTSQFCSVDGDCPGVETCTGTPTAGVHTCLP
ncbi:MAG: hypothetical protein HY238_12225 [Acidobacteria bacterium]|nr:hypothetical protein [Acidobacteriota bacterium]